MPFLCTSRRLQLISIITAVFVILTILIILFLSTWPSFARQRIIENVIFKNGTLEMERFTTTADLKNLRLSISVFSVKNPDEVVKSSARIQLEEIGPFVYHEYKYKEFLMNDQDTGLITYKLRRRYTFRPDLSVGDPTKTNVTWLNVPVISAISLIENMNFVTKLLARGLIQTEMKRVNETAFITDTVENLIFDGSYRKLFANLYKEEVVRKFIKKWPLPDNKFAVLYNKNDTWLPDRDFVFTTAAGFGPNQTHKDLNQYKLMNGSSILPFWKPNGTCNRLAGSDGEFFGPFVNKSESLEVYSLDICRKLQLKYRREVTVQGIKVYEYSLDERAMQSPTKNPENGCYCLDQDQSKCSLDGLIDLSNCISPGVMASGAHFLYGSPQLSARIGGLKPANVLEDEPLIRIEPNTGLSIQVKVPLQINMKLTSSKDWKILNFFKDTEPLYVPLIKVTEAADLDEDQASQLRTKLLILDSWFISMVLGGVIILIVVIVTVIAVLCMRYRAATPQPVAQTATERDPLLRPASRNSPARRSRSPSPTRSRARSRSRSNSPRSNNYQSV